LAAAGRSHVQAMAGMTPIGKSFLFFPILELHSPRIGTRTA
jgi:hypothetical protein